MFIRRTSKPIAAAVAGATATATAPAGTAAAKAASSAMPTAPTKPGLSGRAPKKHLSAQALRAKKNEAIHSLSANPVTPISQQQVGPASPSSAPSLKLPDPASLAALKGDVVVSIDDVLSAVRCPKMVRLSKVLDPILSTPSRAASLQSGALRTVGHRWVRLKLLPEASRRFCKTVVLDRGDSWRDRADATRKALTDHIRLSPYVPLLLVHPVFGYSESIAALLGEPPNSGDADKAEVWCGGDCCLYTGIPAKLRVIQFHSYTELNSHRAVNALRYNAFARDTMTNAVLRWPEADRSLFKPGGVASTGAALGVGFDVIHTHLHPYQYGPVEETDARKLFIFFGTSTEAELLQTATATKRARAPPPSVPAKDGNGDGAADDGGASDVTPAAASDLRDPRLGQELLRGALRALRRASPTQISGWAHLFRDSKDAPPLDNTQVVVGEQCTTPHQCPYHVPGLCVPPSTWRTVFNLPSTPLSTKRQLWNSGYRLLSDLNAKALPITLSPSAGFYLKEAASAGAFGSRFNPAFVRQWVESLRYPVFFIDFETASFSLPPHPSLKSNEALPFQYSMDIFLSDVLTEVPQHHEYLYLGVDYVRGEDPRPFVLQRFMRTVAAARSEHHQQHPGAEAEVQSHAVTGKGSGRKKEGGKSAKAKAPVAGVPPSSYGTFIAHNASFEKRCLEMLTRVCEEHKEAVKHTIVLDDTLKVFRDANLAPPEAQGSLSLKKLLPALCPELSYDANSTITVGTEANDAFIRWYYGDLENAEEIQHTREELLKYTALDTKALWTMLRKVVQ